MATPSRRWWTQTLVSVLKRDINNRRYAGLNWQKYCVPSRPSLHLVWTGIGIDAVDHSATG